MHFIVMGAGRVGKALAAQLVKSDHSVAVISNESALLAKIPQHEMIKCITGFGFDADVLTRAGAQNAFAFAAVTDNDNMNILAARVARERFGIEKVVARIYNSKRAEIFERLGIPTVSTIRWTTDQILRHMIPIGATNEFLDPSGKVSLLQVDYDESWTSHTVHEIQELTSSRIAFITRFGDSFLPEGDTLLQENDILHILVTSGNEDSASHMLSKRFEIASNAKGTSPKPKRAQVKRARNQSELADVRDSKANPLKGVEV
jgi:trk system potassium uptake protein TrkA